jgi:hypothetical protein
MAAPKQNIPLTKAINQLSGEGSGILKDLESLTRRIKSGRKQTKEAIGVGEALMGNVGGKNIRDIAGVAEAAAERLAIAGHLKLAGAFKGMSAIANLAGAARGAAYMGIDLAFRIKDTANELYNLGANPEKILAAARRVNEYQEMVWSNRRLLGDKRTAALLGATGSGFEGDVFGNEMRDVNAAHMESGVLVATQGWRANTAFQRAANRYNDEIKNMDPLSGRAYDMEWTAIKDKILGTNRLAQERDETLLKYQKEEMKRMEEVYEKKKAAQMRTPEGLRARALENLRSLELRQRAEMEWSGQKDWSM